MLIPLVAAPTPLEVQTALSIDTVTVRVMNKQRFPQIGDLVGVRLNLNVLRLTGVPVQTLHAASNRSGYTKNQGFYNGEALGYAGAVTLQNAYFNVHQAGREAIASDRQAKFPMASIDGVLIGTDDAPNMSGVVLRFNPKTAHLFTDEEGFAVHHADEVTIVGNRVYARGHVTYHTEQSAPKRAGHAPSLVRWHPHVELESDTEDLQAALHAVSMPVPPLRGQKL